jgi:peptidoglycan/xylan/chitin deacetylase (PgdA/CDA1 family)
MQNALLLVSLVVIAAAELSASAQSPPADRLVRDKYGAIIRGDVTAKRLALVFTGDEHGESMRPILDTLKDRKVRAGLFVTGNFLRRRELRPLLKRAIAEGHYVGPHSDSHPLYCPWDQRDKSLVTQAFFTDDLRKNLADLVAMGAIGDAKQPLFIPPYEWYNGDQVRWCDEIKVTLI